MKEQPEPAFLTEDEARKAVEDACSLPWLAAVQSTDLRFKSVGPAGIRSALQSFADANEKQRQSLLKIAAIAIAADRQSLVQELEAMAWASLPYCVPGPQVGNESKWVAIFVARYSGARGASTLAEVGARFDLTRERIRQVCERFETALKEHPSAWPALDRVARIASRVAPCSLEEANSQIEPHLGPGMGMEVAVDLAEMLGKKLPIRIGVGRIRVRGAYEEVQLVELSGDDQPWHRASIRYAQQECTVTGATSFLRIAGVLATRDGVAVSQAALESVLCSAPRFVWLDQDNGWFSIGDTSTSAIASRIKKVFAVGASDVTVSQIVEALATDGRFLNRHDETRSLAVPPFNVVQAMVKSWPWVTSLQSTRLRVSQDSEAEVELSDLELLLIKVIEDNGGVAAACQLYSEGERSAAGSKIAIAVCLSNSPVIWKLEQGIYAIRARLINTRALDNARIAHRGRPSDQHEGLADDQFVIRVTEASLRNEQYYVPVHMTEIAYGKQFEVMAGGRPARISATGVLRGLNRRFKDLMPGQDVLVTVRGEKIQFDLMQAGE